MHARARAAQASPFDPLTGMLRRHSMLDEMRITQQKGMRAVVAIIDLDYFKLLNGKHGHQAGDEVLCEIARRLQEASPLDVCLSRFGGDEFVVLVPGDLARATKLVETLRDAIRRPIPLDDKATVAITASAGLAALPTTGHVEDVCRIVDAAVYAAKCRGRDQSLVFEEDVGGVITARRELAAAISVLQERNRELQQLVQTDALTGLRNRRALDQVLSFGVGSAADAEAWRSCAVVFLDIDYFHDYNHLHGDTSGDAVLRQVAEAVRTVARRSDMVFRKGGEELVAVLPETSSIDAMRAAERMRLAVEALAIPHIGSKVADVVTVTVGVATANDDAMSVRQLMEIASDFTMQAKVKGLRNRVHSM